MATTHNYVVTNASYIAGSSSDPAVTIIGSVDGIEITIQVWLSALQQANAAGGITAVKNLIAPIMLAAAQLQQAQSAPATPTQLPTGSFTQ